MIENPNKILLKPLKITCTSTDCKNNLHCFRPTRKMKSTNQEGICRTCGAKLFDMERIHERNFGDVDYTFTSLKFELIRHYFWHVDIDQKAIEGVARKGISKLKEGIKKRILSSVANVEPAFDGRQTPMSGNIIYYGQHATAICCRRCMEEWHGIPRGVALSPEQIDYFTNLIMLYIQERLPYLPEKGEKMPLL